MMGFSGRLWAHFVCMLTEAIFLILFSRMNTVGTALPILILFSAGVQVRKARLANVTNVSTCTNASM